MGSVVFGGEFPSSSESIDVDKIAILGRQKHNCKKTTTITYSNDK